MSTVSSSSVEAKVKIAPKRIRRKPFAIPDSVLHDAELNKAISLLPDNYEFEIHKSVHRLRETEATLCALQFPEGLLMYASIIADIFRRFADCESIVMGDVTYGACCVDDFTAKALGANFFIHYGHSCLVPISVTKVNMLYVFVDIKIDTKHFVRALTENFPSEHRILLAGTIQFASSLQAAVPALQEHFRHITIPQGKPLSRGEVLGCTSPVVEEGKYDCLVFLADGRFHLESMMIQNSHIPKFYKYDPYNKKLTVEEYDHAEMHKIRKNAINTASKAKKWGLILGTLGRQGSPQILARVEALLKKHNMPYVIVCLSEIFPAKLALFKDIGAWTQIACPRLSIDWGYAFQVPLLSSYETEVALKETEWQQAYPMDYYRREGGQWTNYAHKGNQKPGNKASTKAAIKALRARRKARKKKVPIAIDNS